MKLKLFITAWLLSLASGFSQNNGEISGKIIDLQTNETIPYATLIVKANGNEVKTDVSDLDGNFKISGLPLLDSELHIQFIGYETLIQSFKLSQQKSSENLGLNLKKRSWMR